jgi:hypothetical protein
LRTALAVVAPALATLSPLLFAADPATPPAENFVLPLFTDRDGYHSMTVRGASARRTPAGSYAVTDLNVTVFSGDATEKVETVILSADAAFMPKQNLVNGQKSVRVIRDELEVTGEDWSYDHAGKNVSIRKNVRVVYRAPLKIPL